MKTKCPALEPVARKNPNRAIARKIKRCSIEHFHDPLTKTPSFRPKSLCRAPSAIAKVEKPIETQKIGKIRALTQSPKTLPLPELDYQYIVLFFSTWGKSDYITCSEIDFLTEDRVPIQNVQITFTNKSLNTKQNLNDLNFLIDKSLVNTPRGTWSFPWNPEEVPLSLCFSFSSTKTPEYIRIWNGKLNPNSQLKEFRVYFDKKRLYTGEVPCQFGIVAPIKLSDELKLSMYNFAKIFDEEPVYDIDKYGKIYVPPIKQFSIEMIDTFRPGSKDIGLNSIQFFCSNNGKEVSLSSIRNVKITGATSIYSPFQLLKDKKRTMDEKEMWMANRENPKDKVSYFITFNKPVPLILVRIWNFNGDDVDIGVRKALIKLDDNVVWTGCLNKAKGMTSKIVEGVTDIWLSEMEKWKDATGIESILTTRIDYDDIELSNIETIPGLADH